MVCLCLRRLGTPWSRLVFCSSNAAEGGAVYSKPRPRCRHVAQAGKWVASRAALWSAHRRIGCIIYCAWGRHDMKQYPRPPGCRDAAVVMLPSPGSADSSSSDGNGDGDGDASAAIHTLWAGPEHTLMVDDAGRFWACGWNEHGNLGSGMFAAPSEGASEGAWTRVVSRDGQQLVMSEKREASAACGGAHTLVFQAFLGAGGGVSEKQFST